MHTYPKITIAMAVYKPDTTFFHEQLQSLNKQDYKGSLELLVWNDSPEEFQCESYLEEEIRGFPYRVISNGNNNGSTTAFEFLTKEADGKYIAYCDQDDVWRPEKISRSAHWMEEHKECVAVHVGVCYIDKTNRVLVTDLYKEEIRFFEDESFLRRNIVLNNQSYGCALLMRSDIAKRAMPFPKMVYHDQWLMLYATFYGGVKFLPDVLLEHRLHGNNNSQMLHGVLSKSDYYIKKIDKDFRFIHFLHQVLWDAESYGDLLDWVDIRREWYLKRTWHSFIQMYKMSYIRRDIAFFEMLLPLMPNLCFKQLISCLRRIK